MEEEPHIGKLIKAELARQGRSITWLAGQLGCSRQNAYKIFRRKWTYTDLLLKISDILDYDFFKCFSEWRDSRKNG
jgi:lambda repressor-like predicted transcriptional regulator